MGGQPEVLALALTWAGASLAQACAQAQAPGWDERLAGFQALYLTGGEQERLPPQPDLGAAPAAPAGGGALPPDQPATDARIRLRADVLQDGVLLRAMARAAAAPGQVVRVLARRAGEALAFEWQFMADGHTRRWLAPGHATPGLAAVRLDIRPRPGPV